MFGSCSGGMTMSAYLGWLAARGDLRVKSATFCVCVLDMGRIEDSTAGLFLSPASVKAIKAAVKKRGLVSGSEMATMFAWLRANDLVWNYVVNNYLLGNKPPAFDILFWNADATRLPAQFHADLLDLFDANPFVNAGRLNVGGTPIDLSQVKVEAYVLGGVTDHITPWPGCYQTARLYGPKSTFVLSNSGHLQSLINAPGNPKSWFITNPASVASETDWASTAVKVEGSWWPHWRAWIQARSGEQITTRAKLGSRKHKPGTRAPGDYIFEE